MHAEGVRRSRHPSERASHRRRSGPLLAAATCLLVALGAETALAAEGGPTVTITRVPKITQSAFTATFTFSEAVTGFEAVDIVRRNLAASEPSGSGTSYTVTFTPSSTDKVGGDPPRHGSRMYFRLSADSVTSNGTGNAASALQEIRNGRRHTLTISGVPAAINRPFTAKFTFFSSILPDFGVTGFTASDITVTNATLSDFNCTDCTTGTEGGRVYVALITPTAAGEVTISVPQDAADLNTRANHSAQWGNHAASKSGTYTVPPVPVKPTGFAAAAADGRVALSWDDPEDSSITKWQERHKSGSAAFDDSDTWNDVSGSGAGTTGHTVTGLSNGTTYRFRIRAVNIAGNGPESEEASATPASPDPTVVVTGVPATASGAFTATFTFSAAVTGFEVGDITLTGATASEFSGSGKSYTATITPNADYNVSVAANVAMDAAGYGNTASKIESGTYTPVPGKPTGFAAAAADGQVALSWTDPEDSSITKWQERHKFDGSDTWNDISGSKASTTGYTVTGLSNGTTYRFRIRAVNLAGNGPESEEASATPASPDPTVDITGVPATASGAFNATFSFSAAVTGFEVGDITLTGATASGFSGSGKSYTAAITPNADYSVSVAADVAKDADGYGNTASKIESGTYTPVPAKPTGFAAEAADGRVALSWDDPEDSSITKWQERHKSGGAAFDGSDAWNDISGSGARTTGYTVTGLSNGTTYRFRIRAVNAAGNGRESDTRTATPVASDLTPTLTGAIANQELTQGTSYTSAAAFPAATGGDGTITYSVADLPTGIALNSDRKLTGTATAPLADTELTYKATDSDATDPDSATLPFNLSIAPRKPENFTATAGNTEVTLSWTAITGVSGWEVEQDSGSWTAIAGSGAATGSHTVTGLTNGTAYSFRVRAFVGSGATRVHGVESVAATATATPGTFMVPLLPSASDPARQGFVRIVNRSPTAGTARLEAIDDAGRRYGPITLSIGTNAARHFNSDDLEAGNPGKGLSGGVGPGEGDWRLDIEAPLDLEVLSYIRTADGFVTSMHDLSPATDGEHRVVFFNPGSNVDQVSRLRLINPGDVEAEVAIRGVDDAGASPGGAVRVTVPAGAASTFTAAELESGAAGRGALGDGVGKWRLTVESERPVLVMSLLASPAGHLTNLSGAPDGGEDAARVVVPLFPSASEARWHGFLRVVNRSAEAGDVRVVAFDDTDWDYDPVTLALAGGRTMPFNSFDLELGNADKGLSGGTGAGTGDWRLDLTADELDIEAFAYVRTKGGFVTSMHDLAPAADGRHRVVFFNPGSNDRQVSRLRLVNPGSEDAEVAIRGVDDAGASPGDEVRVAVPAGDARSFTAAELEAGGDDLDGALGDGAGKWRLTVESEQPILVMSLLESPTGHLTNLSAAPAREVGP